MSTPDESVPGCSSEPDLQKLTAPKRIKLDSVTMPPKQKRSRKRKFHQIHPDYVVIKKKRKYLYLHNSNTKPRRLKTKLTPCVEESLPPTLSSDLPKNDKTHYIKIDKNGVPLLFSKNQSRNDVGDSYSNLDPHCNYYTYKKCDLSFYLIDEIALEGLDGITVEALRKRLKTVFPNNISNSMFERLWKIISSNKRIAFYLLPEPRGEFIYFERRKYIEMESGMFVDAFVDYKEIYSTTPVNYPNLKGCCASFETRKENNAIRRLTLDKAIKGYGQSLVLVADQTLRNKAIINEETDPTREIQDAEYCLLEKIGRSRYEGELTHGKISLQTVQYDAKFFYHNKKNLVQNNLATSQPFALKSARFQFNTAGAIMHLTRFYNKCKLKHIMAMEHLANCLREKPNYEMEYSEIRNLFGRSSWIIKLVKSADFRKFFKSLVYPYRALYPDAPKHEWASKSCKTKEKLVRVIKLIDPCCNVAAILDKTDVSPPVEAPESNNVGQKSVNYEVLKDIFLYLVERQEQGATVQEIIQHFKIDHYITNSVVRKLLLKNVIETHKIDMGRQQSFKFVAKYLRYPDIQINLRPKKWELDNYVALNALKGYDKPIDESFEMYTESDDIIAIPTLPSSDFTINFDNLGCNVFMSDFLDSTIDEFKLFDIINKGRDRLLLVQSNLNVMYIGEWDNVFLKRSDFFQFVGQVLSDGFGKIICDYLMTLALATYITTDNQIIFNLDNLAGNRICKMPLVSSQSFVIKSNNKTYYNDCRYQDLICLVYQFENLFNDEHLPVHVILKMRDVVDRVLLDEGRKLPKKLQIDKKKSTEVIDSNVMASIPPLMGPNPLKVFEETVEGITVEIFASTIPEIEVEDRSVYSCKDDFFKTQRYIDRANTILKIVQEKQMIPDFVGAKILIQKEAEQGYDKTVCRKSFKNIVKVLIADGYIKAYRVFVKNKYTVRAQTFLCDPSINYDHEIIRVEIDHLKMKCYCFSMSSKQQQQQTTTTLQRKNTKISPFSTNDVKSSILELKKLTSSKQEIIYKYDVLMGKKYGYSPKFARMRILHEFLFYLIYAQESCKILKHSQVAELCDNFKIQLKKSDILTIPPIYCKEISWKMFIPPLPNHQNWPKGWALVCDIILRLPLSVFLKLHNCCYIIPELNDYLKHPINRHILIKDLPVNIKNVLFIKRKYLTNLSEILNSLCNIGLLQLGPRKSKDKELIFIYLNRKASLLDTTSSKAGYNLVEDKKYESLNFQFKTAANVEFYWSEMWRICLNTPLGRRKVMDGQFVTIESCLIKPSMLDTLKPRTKESVTSHDTGEIPGDHRGAAGLDSSLWSFVRRNWLWSVQENKTQSSEVPGLHHEKLDIILPKPIPFEQLKTKMKQRKTTTNVRPLNVKIKKKNLRKIKFTRQIVFTKKRVREYYDAIDKAIMKKNRQTRVDWDETEDFYLRFLRISSLFLCNKIKKQVMPYTIMRDILHRIYPKSKNKTAKAIQRRIYFLLLTDEIIKIMETNTDNLLNSEVLAKYFGQMQNQKYSDAEVIIAFVYFMSYIKKHAKEMELLLLGYIATVDFFSYPYISLFELILENVIYDEKVTIYKTPEVLDDIKKDTIKSVIHCSMGCEVGPRWGYKLFRIYREYPDELIKASVMNLKKAQLLTLTRRQQEKKLANWHLPLKFSFAYNAMKNSTYTLPTFKLYYKKFDEIMQQIEKRDECFFTYSELNTVWHNYSFNFYIPEKGIILNPNINDHTEIIDELATRFLLYLKKINEGQNEITTKTDDIAESNQAIVDFENIKNRTIQLIFRVPYLIEGNIETYIKKLKESQMNLEITNCLYLMIVELKKFASDNVITNEMQEFVDNIDIEADIDNETRLVKHLAKVVFAIQNLCQENQESLEDKFHIWEAEENAQNDGIVEEKIVKRKSLKKYSSGMDACITRALNGDIPSLEEIKCGIMDETSGDNRTIPHITDLTMLLTKERFPELDADDDTIEEWKEHFVMQYPEIKELNIENFNEFKQNPIVVDLINEEKIQHKNQLLNQHNYDITKEFCMEKIKQYVESLNGTSEDLNSIKQLIQFIADKKEFGAKSSQIKKYFHRSNKLDLLNLLKFLCSINLLLRTGIVEIVYVHYEFRNEWLVKTYPCNNFKENDSKIEELDVEEVAARLETDTSIKIWAKLTPWTTLDGAMNYELFEEWLGVVLSRCLDFPNIPFLGLCDQLLYLKPVDLFTLLEVLEDLKCIELWVFNQETPGLFSARVAVEERRANCLDDFNAIFVKPRNVSGMFFGSFLHT